MTHDERYKKSGLTVSLGGALADSITNATRTIKQAGSRDDKRLAGLELNEARKQLQDGYAAVDKAVKGVKLRDNDGKVLKDTKNHSRRGQKNIDDAINLSVSIGSTSRKQGQVVDTNTYQGGTLVSENDVHIIARDAEQSGIGLIGETVEAKKLVLDSASDINLEAAKNTVDVNNTYKSSGWSVGAGISLTGGGLLDINASGHMARQNGDTHQETYVPTKIKTVELAQLKAKRDTNIIGSTVSGKKVEVNTGGDLHIQSLQDVDNFKEHSKSAGFSVSSKPNFKDPTGSINASVGRIDSKWKSVTQQAGIYAGEEGYDINVGNSTTLEGAVIKSDALKAKNKLTTKSLEMKDIQNEAEYAYSNNGIGYNYYGSKKKLEEMKTNDKKGYDKIYNNIGLVPNLGVGSKGKASSTTQSAISDGILTVDGKEIDTKTINTNTENTLHQLDKIFDKKKIEERQELARLFSKNAFEQLHNWQPTTKDGKVAKSIAHGIIGEVAARMAGNAPGSGFKATMTNELLIGEIKKVAKHDPALAQWLSAVVGGVVNKASGKNVNTGAAVASYATKWNDMLASEPGKYAFYDNYAQAKNDQEIFVSNEYVEPNTREKSFIQDLEAYHHRLFIAEHKNDIPFAAPLMYVASQGYENYTFTMDTKEGREIAKSPTLRSEIRNLLTYNGTGIYDNVNIFSKDLVFTSEAFKNQLYEGNIELAKIEFGLAAAFHNSTVSATAKLIDESSTTRTYYVYGFVGDKVKFRSSDNYKGVLGMFNPIGVEWQQSGAIATTNAYVEFQMEVEVKK